MRSRLSVFWVRADDLANFLDDFSQIMDLLKPSDTHMSTSQDFHLLAEKVTARLEKDPSSWLLVLDNADNYDLFVGIAGRKNSISNYVPKEGRVLITTRDPRFQGTVVTAKNGLHVQPMDTNEARDLFMKLIPDHLASQSSPAIVNELLDLLGNLPLALAQAAANIAHQQCPVQEYIAAYRDKRNRPLLMEKPMLDLETTDSRTSRQSILVTYEISFEDLERTHQSSARCLNYFGFFHWQKIPESCIRALPGLRELDDQAFRNTIKRLLHLSMIEENSNPDGSEYSVHPIIHERISDRLSLEEKRSYLSDIAAVMSSKFPSGKSEIFEIRSYLSSCRYLQSHALLQINLATEFDLKSKELAGLNQHCAAFMRNSGMTVYSVQLATQAVAMEQEIWGPHSIPTILACVEKVTCLVADSQYREAYNESQSVMERLDSAEAIGAEQKMVLRTDILAGKLRACLGLEEYKEAVDILRNDLPEDFIVNHPDRRVSVYSLLDQGRFQEAQEMNNELLSSIDAQQGISHRRIWVALCHLKARILSGMREGSDAEPAMVLGDDEEQTILRIYRDVFNEHRAELAITEPSLWGSCCHLLHELREKGKTPEAADILVSILTEAVDSRLCLEGQITPIFSITLLEGLGLIDSLHEYRDARQVPPGLPIANLFVQIIALAGTASRRLWRHSRMFLLFPGLFQRLGDSHKAEGLLQEVLQDNSLEEDRWDEGLIHYHLMMAVARQGRTDDARRYRNKHFALIAPEESKYGDLDWNLKLDREEKGLYDKAKGIIATGNTNVPERWWNEHRIALNRAQLKYGLLVPANAEEDSGPEEDASDLTEKKQKRTLRKLGGLIDKLQRNSHPISHTSK